MPNSTSAAPIATLERRLGLWSAIAVVIGSTIGSGIFRSPAGIAARIPGPLPMLMIWVAGGIFAICGALTMAEVASALPRTGGIYVFCKEGWGRLAGFLFGWGQLVMIRAASLGAIATTFAEYSFRVTGRDPASAEYAPTVKWVAGAAIILTAIFNIRGVKLASTVINLSVVAKYGALVFIVIIAFVLGLPKTGGHFTPLMPVDGTPITSAAFGLALVSVLWAFDGWADLAYNAGEVKDPGRNIPRALIGGTLAVLFIYLAANLAYLAVLPVDQIATSKLVAADVAQIVIGPVGVTFVGLTVMLSTFGTLNAVLFTSPRVFFAMAADGTFFKQVAAVHPKYGTPWVSIMMTAGIAILLLPLGFDKLADVFVTAFLPFYFLAVASIFRLRKRADWAPTFRVPLYPVVPLVFLASILYLLGNAVLEESSRMSTLGVFGVVLLGIPVYYLTVGRAGRDANRG